MTHSPDQPEQSRAPERGANGRPAPHPGAAALQDQAAINAGFTGDKVAGLDLAASPLGTDDEAGGGTAATPARTPTGAVEGGAARDPNRANAVRPPVPWLWVVVAVAAAVVLAWGLYAALA